MSDEKKKIEFECPFAVDIHKPTLFHQKQVVDCTDLGTIFPPSVVDESYDTIDDVLERFGVHDFSGVPTTDFSDDESDVVDTDADLTSPQYSDRMDAEDFVAAVAGKLKSAARERYTRKQADEKFVREMRERREFIDAALREGEMPRSAHASGNVEKLEVKR